MADVVAYPIQIYTLGTLRVVRAGYTVAESDWQTRQARQLLKILITERPRPVSTDRLIDLLWPDSASQAAATTLRSAINSLRNVLEPERPNRAPSHYIITQTPGYAFPGHDHIWLDIDAFDATLTLADKSSNAADKVACLQRAVALYADDYLTSDPYADWARHERERLRERYLAALLQIAALQAEQADYTAAIATARQVLTRDPLRESAYQALMHYQAEAGDSASALITYERCRALLAEELGADPSPLTQAWHQRILNGEVGPTQIATAPAQPTVILPAGLPDLPQQILLPVLDEQTGAIFVGRTNETAQITARLQATLAGNGGILCLEGEAGVGKTRLAYHSLQWAAAAGATILSAVCQPLEQQLPFAPLVDVVGRYLQRLSTAMLQQLPAASLAQLAQLLPSLQDRLPDPPITYAAGTSETTTQSDDQRQRVIESLITLFATLATVTPIVLFLDDLQWSDSDTLAVLSRLAPRLHEWPLFVLLAYRTEELAEHEELSTLLHALRRINQHLSLPVARFAHRDVQQYIQQMTGQDVAGSTQLAAALYAATQGNALFVTEALRDLQERHAATSPQGNDWPALLQQWSTAQPPTLNLQGNQRVQEIILERIHRLPNPARDLLQLAAVIGRDFSLDLLEQLAPRDPLAALAVLLQRRFLVERPGDRLDFSHQLVRQVAYDNLFVLQRRRLHLSVADALAASPRASEIPGEIAFHYRKAGGSATLLLAQYAVLTGERLLRAYGFRQAIEAFDETLSLLETPARPLPDWQRRALEGRGLAYEALFDPVGVTDTYRRLQQWAQAQGDHQLLLTAHSRLTTMLSLLGQQRESNELLRDLLDALADSPIARSAVMVDLFQRRQRIYVPDAVTDVPSTADEWAVYQPPPPVVVDAPAELLQTLSPLHATLPLFMYSWILRIQGQLPAAIHCLEAVVDLAKRTGQPTITSMAYHQLAIAARMQGDLAASHTLNDQSLAINQTMQGSAAELTSMWPRISSAFMALQRNELAEAERRLRRVADFLGDQDLYRSYRTSAQIGLGLVALARGEYSAAQAQLHSALADSVNLYPYIYVQGLLGLASIAHAQGDGERCRQILQQALRYAGARSLLEEYIATVLRIADLQPIAAPTQSLLAAALTYVEALPLPTAAQPLRTALAPYL